MVRDQTVCRSSTELSFFVTNEWCWNWFFLKARIVMELRALYAYQFVQYDLNYYVLDLRVPNTWISFASSRKLTNRTIMNNKGHKRKIRSFLKSNQKSVSSETRELSVLILMLVWPRYPYLTVGPFRIIASDHDS